MMEAQTDVRSLLERLQHLQAENVACKNRLAHKIQTEQGNAILEQAEHFQTQFLDKDVAISLLRHELTLHGLGTAPTGGGQAATLWKMEEHLHNLEENHRQLKEAFHHFLGAPAV